MHTWKKYSIILNLSMIFVMFASVIKAEPARAASYTPALTFNGSSQYVTFGTASPNNGFLMGDSSSAWVSGSEAQVGASALKLNGSSQYVSFGLAPELGVKTFTIETWFKRTGNGIATKTANGIDGLTSAIPLVTKGRMEADNSNKDLNYFLGISTDSAHSNHLAADFEACSSVMVDQGCPSAIGEGGMNHAVYGVTQLQNDRWYHAAATFDGQVFSLYLNGILETSTDLGKPILPRWDSIEPAALGTALNSLGTADGYFAGVMDETRIWDTALSMVEIQAMMNSEVSSADHLIGRWGLDEGNGNKATDSAKPDLLGLRTFTLETWINWNGSGVTTNTGGGSTSIYPIITKGHSVANQDVRDLNYFLGISKEFSTSKYLAADFKDVETGANHPVYGITPITPNTWHHVAATYDGTTWRLYLDGNLETTLAVNKIPRYDSIEPLAIASALDIYGNPLGYFGGSIDETRIWNIALTQEQIRTGKDREISSAPGLVARWGYNEGNGSSLLSSTGNLLPGLTKYNPAWGNGFPIDTQPPAAPVELAANPEIESISLTWEAGLETDLAGYNVYRSTTSGSYSPTPLNGDTLVTDSAYSDMTARHGTTYYYVVTAIDFSGNESVVSSEVSGEPVKANLPPGSPVLVEPGDLATNVSTAPTLTVTAADADDDPLTATFYGRKAVTEGVPDDFSQIGEPVNISSGSNASLTWADLAYSTRYEWYVTLEDGTTATNSAIWSFTTKDPNYPPVAAALSIATDEDQPLEIQLTANDDNGDLLTFAVTADPSHGKLSGTPPDLTYSPDQDFFGNDEFTFIAKDALLESTPAKVTITVRSVNDLPICIAVNITANEDGSGEALPNCSDIDDDLSLLSYWIKDQPAHGSAEVSSGKLVYSPEQDFNGSDQFTYVAKDVVGESLPAVVTIEVTAVNDAPVCSAAEIKTDEDVQSSVIPSCSDVDNALSALVFVIDTQPTIGTALVENGKLIYSPNLNQNGADSFKYKAYDGSDYSAPQTVSVTVQSINDAPICQGVTLTTNNDETGSQTPDCLDVEGESLSYVISSQPANGTAAVENGRLVYQPKPGYSGSDSFKYQAQDNDLPSFEATVSVTVIDTNRAPVCHAIASTTIEGYPVDILPDCTDPDGNVLTYTIVSQPANGSVLLHSSKFSYTPKSRYSGADTFQYKANDGKVDSNSVEISLTIEPKKYIFLPLMYK